MLPNQSKNVTVLVGGSRSLSPAGCSLAARVGSVLAARGVRLSVGCASGADACVLSAFVAAGAAARASVFAVGLSSGAGFPVRGVPAVVAAAAAAGASVVWAAGGPVSGPGWLPLRARLARRSRASAVGVAAAVFVVGSAVSPGSFGCARFCVASGVPVFVSPVGFAASALPLLGAGSWIPSPALSSLFGASFFRWVPSQEQLPLENPPAPNPLPEPEKPTQQAAVSNRQHIVFCPKYRRSVLVGCPAQVVERVIREKCATLGVEILALSVMPDHVHLVAKIPARLAISEIVRHIKGSSARNAREVCPELKATVHENHLWAKRYFSVSVGGSALKKVRKYVENQEGKE